MFTVAKKCVWLRRNWKWERISKLNCQVISAIQIWFLVDTVWSSQGWGDFVGIAAFSFSFFLYFFQAIATASCCPRFAGLITWDTAVWLSASLSRALLAVSVASQWSSLGYSLHSSFLKSSLALYPWTCCAAPGVMCITIFRSYK